MGLDPVADNNGTDCVTCTCVESLKAGDANALQVEISLRQLLASIDGDIRKVICVWVKLPERVRIVLMALIDVL